MSRESRNEKKQYYGCVQCRQHHYEGQPLFEEHIWWQTVEGVRELPLEDWRVRTGGAMGHRRTQSPRDGAGAAVPEDLRHYYGCVQCRRHHYEGEEVYREHFWWQTQEGVLELSEREWTLRRLQKAG